MLGQSLGQNYTPGACTVMLQTEAMAGRAPSAHAQGCASRRNAARHRGKWNVPENDGVLAFFRRHVALKLPR